MNRRRATVALAIAGLVTAAPTLAACGAGKDSGTAQVRNTTTGADVTVSPAIGIRNAYILSDTDTSARLFFAVANTGATPDKLTSVTSPAASAVQLAGSGQLNPLASATPTPPAPDGGLTVPAGQIITLRPGQTGYVMTLSKPVNIGEFVALSVSFTGAGQASFRAPVVNPVNQGNPPAGPTVAATPTALPADTTSPSASAASPSPSS